MQDDFNGDVNPANVNAAADTSDFGMDQGANERRFTVEATRSGPQDIDIQFANGASEVRSARFWIGDRAPLTVEFPSTGSWTSWDVLRVRFDLAAGTHSIAVTSLNNAGPDIAGISLREGAVAGSELALTDDASAMALAAIAAVTLSNSGLAASEVAAQEQAKAPIDVDFETQDAGGETASNRAQPLEEIDLPEASAPSVAVQKQAETAIELRDAPEVIVPQIVPVTPQSPDIVSSFHSFAQAANPEVETPQQAIVAAADEPAALEEEPAATAFQPLRLQAEAGVRGFITGGNQTVAPTVVDLSSTVATDRENAAAADGDAYVDFAGFNGNFNAGAGQYVEWTFEVSEAGQYDLGFGYAFFSSGVANRPMRLDVNGAVWDRIFDFANTGANTTYAEATTRVNLTAGTNTVRLTANGFSGPNLDYMEVRAANPNKIVVQAEDLMTPASQTAATTGNRPITLNYLEGKPTAEQFRVGAEGDGYLDWGSTSQSLTFALIAETAGEYTVSMTYANGGTTPRPLTLTYGNGISQTFPGAVTTAPVSYPEFYDDIDTRVRPTDGPDAGTVPDPTGFEGWTTQTLALKVTMTAGLNVFTLSGTNGPNIDKLEFVLVEPASTNAAPTAVAGIATTTEDSALIIDVATLVGDADGDALTITATVPAAQGTVTVNGTQITFNPAANFNGAASIAYTVTDPDGASASAAVAVTVGAANDAPTLAGTIANQEMTSAGGEIALGALVATDVDGTTPSLGLRLAGGGALPQGVSLVDGKVMVDATVAAGTYALEVYATDGSLNSAPVAFTLTKAPTEVVPEPQPFTPFVVQAESGVVVDLAANATPENNTQIRNPSNPENPANKIVDAFNLRPNYSGSGYVDFGSGNGSAGDSLTLAIDVPTAGTYTLYFRYANGGTTARPLALSVNGIAQGDLAFAAPALGTVDPWSHWMLQPVTVTLAAGANAVKLTINAASLTGPNVDAVAITAVGGTPNFFVPVISSASAVSVAEGASMAIDVNATDRDGTTLVYGISGAGADDALFQIDPATGVLTFIQAPNFEAAQDAGADNVYSVEVTVSDGTSVVKQTIAVTVTDVNEAPGAVTVEGALSLAENATSGTVIGTVSATDPDGDTLVYSVSDSRFVVNNLGQIVVADGATFDFETASSLSLTVTASDGSLSASTTVTVAVTDVSEVTPPTNVVFNAATLTSYSEQDRGAGASVADEGATLKLDGNLWKRAPLGTTYTITEGTKLVFEVAVGTSLSEIIAIGFDDDNSPFEMADQSVYQIGGAQTQAGFVDLRNGVLTPEGTIIIDLSAHAGKTISSLVFVADDDVAGDGVGSVSFSNVQLIRGETSNRAPEVLGGGIADLVLPERSPLEIDLPFVDRDGDALSYTIEVRNAAGDLVPSFGGLTVVAGTLTGALNVAPGIYSVTVIASDGMLTASDVFALTVEDINDAPVVRPDLSFEPYFGKVGEEIPGIDLALFSEAFSDADGDALVITVEGLPAGLSVNAEGVIVGTPTTAVTSITIVATDPLGERATFVLPFVIEGASVGDVVTIEAEDFTGLATATGFYAAAAPGASGNEAIRTNPSQAGAVSTTLGQNGVSEGWYTVSLTVFDENDGTSRFTLRIGDTVLADNVTFDALGTFDNPSQPRGNAGQVGNLKTISFTTPVFIDADTIASITGQSDAGEYLRIDKMTLVRVAPPQAAPTAVILDTAVVAENAAGAVIGTLSSTDPDGNSAAITYATGDARFVVVGNQLRLAPGTSLDHEAAETVTVRVTATDAQGQTTATDLTVSVGDVNEAPVLPAGADIADVSLVMGTAGSVDLAALGFTDPDQGAELSLVARLGNGAALPSGITLNGGVLQIAATVPSGSYAITVFATDGALDSDSVSFTVNVTAPAPEQPFTLLIQAESAALTVLDTDANTNDTTIRNPSNPETSGTIGLVNGLRPGFTGTGYIDYGDTAGDRALFTFDVPASGAYDLKVRYASNTARPLDLSVNGASPMTMAFVATGTNTTGPAEGFNNWSFETIRVQLQAGSNTLSFAIPQGATTGPNLDSLELTRVLTVTDASADVDGNLFLSGPDGVLTGANKESINFNLAGRDSDIVSVAISFNGGATKIAVLPDADGDFVVSGSSLTAGAYTATVYVTDAAGNTASTSMPIEVGGATVQPFSVLIEAETFTVTDVEAVASTPADTVARTAANKEPNANAANSGAGLEYNADGLRPGYEGAGYLDMGNDVGDRASFSVTTTDAGVYQLTIRYANGGVDARPMVLSVGGVQQTVQLPSTIPTPGGTAASGWANWKEVTVDVTLAAGANSISLVNTITNGPNIDNVTVSREGTTEPVDTREQIRFEEVIKINFEPGTTGGAFGTPTGYLTPTGFVADTGAAYGSRGNGFTYGWVDVENGVVTGVAKAQPTGSMRYKNDVPEASALQKTYAHFEYPGAPAADNERAWEMALEDGTYQLTMSIGDTGGPFDSNYVINVEGRSFMPDFVPQNLAGQSPVGSAYNTSQDGQGFRSTLVTGIVTVTDGKLTIDSIGGNNTEIQYLEIERIPDLTPNDGRAADLDFSLFAAPMADNLEGQTPITIGEDGSLPTGIDPSSSFVVGVQLQATGNRGPNIAHVENVKLVETLTGIEVAIDVQISGGSDSITIRPLAQLKENTSYTLKVQDVLDLGSITDPNGALRQFQDLTRTFVTGEAVEDVPREVAFSTQTLLNGFADGAGGYTSIEFGPDGKLYVATITGEVHRWSVNADGTINKASQETLSLDYLKEADGDRRGIVGFVFDPDKPGTIWISDNAPIPREAKAFDTPEFSGRVSKITLGEGGSFVGAKAETYITGLPRSGGDHLTNSLEFRDNPNAGQPGEPDHLLYLSQGSNSAAGAPDDAWGARPERLLNAAILEIDPTRTPPTGGFDVRTEPVSLTDDPKKTFPASQFNADGTYPGSYNPFAADAVLKIFATGVRNAYDLVWHSNGQLYVPTNGTASGGKTPNDPTQPGLDTVISNSPKQYDYFFTVEEGKYYGHPNVLRDEYVLNGGNPTGGRDPNEVVGGNDGNNNTDGYQVGVRPDGDYDLDGVYNLGYNRSPNGATEYTGNAFGSNLKGAILFAQFSTGDNVRVIKVDAQGKIIGDDVLRRPDGSVIDDYIDPLDIIENPVTGQLYLMTLNRGTGASQLILLTPAPGGVTADITADEGGNLLLTAFNVTDPTAAVFQVTGLDSDITSLRVSFNNGPETSVTLNAQGRFTFDITGLTGSVTARLRVTDDALNTATASTTFTPGQTPTTPDYVTLVTIQAEDRTPNDGTSVVVPTGATAQIQIRDASNPETGVSGTGYVNGLRPGAFGTDGNTVNTDGVPGGYADFGSTNVDYLTFNFSAPSAGSAILRFRYSNGGTTDRPLQLEVNGSIVKVQSFAPTATATNTDGFTVWAEVEVPVSLLAGQNSVTLRSVNATGPNIDQMVVLIPEAPETLPNDGEVVVNGVTYVRYEAEKADLGGAPSVVTENRNQSGSFIDFQGPDTETITWTIEVGAAGTYGVDILYALGAGKAARPMTISVNGQVRETLPFAANSTAAENSWGPQSSLLQLNAGVNTITLTASAGNGPNIDLLRVTKAPVAVFEPDYAELNGSGRIELETTDGSAHVINGSTVEFFFTVATSGVYKLDSAANASAANGQGLTWFLNGVEVDDGAFPGVGQAGEQSIYVELQAGTQYKVRIVSDAPGASGLDYLDVNPAPGNPNADIAIQSLDPAYFDDRLHFSYLQNPSAVDPTATARDMKDSGTVRITNTGTEPLTFTDFEIDGPFVLANPTIFNGLSLAAGQSIDVTVLFNRSAYTPPTSNVDGTSTVFQGKLTLITNDADNPISTVDLAGFWQSRDEGGHEPNVNEIWKIFGFGNVIEGLRLQGGGENSTLSTKDVFAKTDATEVLSPYWKLADGVSEAKITHIAAFHGDGGATVHLHNPGNKGQNTQLWNHEGNDNQRLLPNMNNDTTFASVTFNNGRIPDNWVGNEVFGISVAGLSTDPRLNPRGDELVEGAQQGHTVKMFQALDAEGNVIPNVYLGIMDYTGINYDYNDNMFVIEGVMPVGFGQDLRVAGLDDAAADDRLVFTNIDQPVNAQQAFRNEAVLTIANDGFAALNISSIVSGNPAFQIVGTVPTSIAAGGSAQITVRFVGTHTGSDAGAELYRSTLTITSDDYAEGVKVIQLAGLAQEFSERNSEPTVAQIVEAFGYSTDMAQGELAGGGVVELIGDEVLLPYLERLDGSRPVEVIQLAAFLNQGNVARLGFHGLGSSAVTNLFANDDQQGQTILPDQLVAGSSAGATVARGTINQAGPFGIYISVDGRPTYSSWSDPEANKIDPNFGQLVGDNQGHLIRYFQALDAQGNVIAGTYIGIQDYPGAGNYDYNDHMFVIKNVKPYALTAANDANGDGINDALQLDADNDGTVNFFDPNTAPPAGPQQPFGGTAPTFTNGILNIDATNYDTGGQGVAYNDNAGREGGNTTVRPGDGVELVGTQNDIGYVRAGEWVEYTINVQQAGVYDLSFLAKTPLANASIAVSLAGGATLGTVTLQDGGTGFDTAPFQNSSQLGVTLAAGFQTLRLTFNGTPPAGSPYLLDLRSFTLDYREPPVSTQTPFGGTAPVLGTGALTIDASNYDNGGQGLAYNDLAGIQGGTNGGRTGSAVEQTSAGDIGYIENGEWLEYTIDVDVAGRYDLSLLLSNAAGAGRVARVDFYSPDESSPYATSGNIANPVTTSWTSFASRTATGIVLEEGVQVVRITFTGGNQDFRSFTLQPSGTTSGQTPYSGTAPVLGTSALVVDASNFDNGGQGVAYNDNSGLDGGNTAFRPGREVEMVGAENDIGFVKPGEWVEYTINVATAGTYGFSVNAKTPVAGATVTVSQAGGATLGVVTLADGHAGGSNFDSAAFAQSTVVPLTLAAGVQTIRLAFNGPLASNGYVLDLRSFTLAPQAQQTPVDGTPPVLGDGVLTIEGIDYDNGGQGVAYNDQAGLQGGSNGGRAGSSVEVTISGDIGWINSGEWLEYTITVEEAGSYAFNLSMALGDATGPNRSVTATFTNGGAVDTVTLNTPRTGTWSNFQNTQTATVDLDAGTTVVRLTFNGGSQDLSSFSLRPAAPVAAQQSVAMTDLFFAQDAAGTADLADLLPDADDYADAQDAQIDLGVHFGYDLNA